RGRHVPLALDDRLADAIEVAAEQELLDLKAVAEVTLALQLELGVVAPEIGVADLVVQRLGLLERAAAGGVVHPRERGLAPGEGVFDGGDHLEGDVLAGAREALLDEGLAHDLAEAVVGEADAALPSRREPLG